MTSKQANQPIALLSVTDKTGIVEFARALQERGFRILSTGGTAKLLAESEVNVEEVASYTKSPEILDGRVKTLHPLVHGGILYDRENNSHIQQIDEHGISSIDVVAVNLYNFAGQALEKELSLEEAIKFIDIGGPTMLRAAAKNYRFCLPLIDPSDYQSVIEAFDKDALGSKAPLRAQLAAKVFATISSYDSMITNYFQKQSQATSDESKAELGPSLTVQLERHSELRYGENPKQVAGFYSSSQFESGLQNAKVLQGKALSYNNYLDVDAAVQFVCDFKSQAVMAVIKHTNPCGSAIEKQKDESLLSIYERALAGDPQSAFGGIIATNRVIDAATATSMSKTFLECIAAPDFSPEALEIFAKKKNLRLLQVDALKQVKTTSESQQLQLRSIKGGVLVQSWDRDLEDFENWKQVSEKAADPAAIRDLVFSWTLVKHVKSNAIAFARDASSLAVGAGQMSRVDSIRFAIQKAHDLGKDLKGSVLSSDAFFPFRDSIDTIASHGIKAIVQPGGSVRDEESIAAANEHGIAMYFTGNRHFRH